MTEAITISAKRSPQFALTVTCPSAPGQVAAMVRFLDEHGCYIDEFNVFDDDSNARFLCAVFSTQLLRTSCKSTRCGQSSWRSPSVST